MLRRMLRPSRISPSFVRQRNFQHRTSLQSTFPSEGRTLKVAGDRTFETWTITVINDEDFKIRHAMEMWMNGIAKLENYTGATNPTTYMRDAYVYQLGRGGKGKRNH